MPNYTFKTGKKADGSIGYYVNGKELQDKESYDRIKQKADQAGDKSLQEVESEFDNATSSSGNSDSSSELDSMFKKAKGGKIKKHAKGGSISLNNCKVSTHSKSKKQPNW